MDTKPIKSLGFDGDDQIIFSNSFNIYKNKLTITPFEGQNFIFVFQKTEPAEGQKDITFTAGGVNELVVTLSKKFRNSLGSISSEKLTVLNTDNGQVLFSIFGQELGENNLHITVSVYFRSN